MKIIPLSEGAFTIDKSKLFIPFDPQTDVLQQRASGSLLVEIQPFIIITSKDILLLDSGLGFNDGNSGQMQLHTNLLKNGINPEKVTKVLMSHLHKDHAGAVCMQNNPSVLSLPNAIYYVQERELEFAFSNSSLSYLPEEIKVLKNEERVVLLRDDFGLIDDYIEFQLTGAHCPYHQVFWIREKNETIFFGGDVAPQLQQMRMRYKTKYDYEPEKALQLRQKWWQEGNKDGWTFLFYHDIKNPVYKVI